MHDRRHLGCIDRLIGQENIGQDNLERGPISVAPLGFPHQVYHLGEAALANAGLFIAFVDEAGLAFAVTLKLDMEIEWALDFKVSAFGVDGGGAAGR